ncbi:unnamed protein product [Heterobilharzia americana]|nr:unnamed protein product [Heterobilharzia americana]
MLSACRELYLSLKRSVVNWSFSNGLIEETVLPEVITESACGKETGTISFFTVSTSGFYLSVVDSAKQLYLYARKNDQWLLLSQLKLHKQVSCLLFSPSEGSLLIGDKSGDIYKLFISEGRIISEKDLTCICGHLSLLSHLAISDDELYLASCDRDEKIRISRFSQPYVIQSFCLGHTSFVSQLAFIPNSQYLISTGGDGDFKVWNCVSGECLSSYHVSVDELPSPSSVSESDSAEAVVSRLYVTQSNVIVCSFFSHPVLSAFYLHISKDNEAVHWGSRSFISTPDNLPIIDMVLFSNAKANDDCITDSLIIGMCSTSVGVRLFSWKLTVQYNAYEPLCSLKWEDPQRIDCMSDDILSKVPSR